MSEKAQKPNRLHPSLKIIIALAALIGLYIFVTKYIYPTSYMSSDSTESGMEQLKTKFEER